MPDILHRIEVKSSPDDAYRAIATCDGLANWWTTDTKGEARVGGVITFRFGDRGFFAMQVIDLEPGERVLWQVVDGAKEWIGTRIGFDLAESGDDTVVLFGHRGWREPTEFMHHCSTKWATFLLSLKSLVETGRGAPYPDDVHITVKDD